MKQKNNNKKKTFGKLIQQDFITRMWQENIPKTGVEKTKGK